MSTTFKSIDETRNLHVSKLHEYVLLTIEYPGNMRMGITLDASVIPGIALAELEAAGHTPEGEDYLSGAVESLQIHCEEEEATAVAARELAELEAEALELRNAFTLAIGGRSIDSFAEHSVNKPGWIDAARRAREMRAEK